MQYTVGMRNLPEVEKMSEILRVEHLKKTFLLSKKQQKIEKTKDKKKIYKTDYIKMEKFYKAKDSRSKSKIK